MMIKMLTVMATIMNDDVLTFRCVDGESSCLHQRADPTGCLEVMMVFGWDGCKDCTFVWTFEE